MKTWKEISVDQYELYVNKMALTKTLNNIFKSKLKEYGPDSLAIWGVGLGSGLDQIKDLNAISIVGIDINQNFLNTCTNKFQKDLPKLKLKNMDLDKTDNPIFKSDLIWASLIFEYLKDLSNTFKYAANSLDDNGIISIVFEDSVSSNDKLPAAKKLDANELEKIAEKYNLHLIDSAVVTAPSGIKLHVLDFIKNNSND